MTDEKVIDPEFESLPEVKRYRKKVRQYHIMIKAIQHIALIMAVVVIISIFTDNDILKTTTLAVDISLIVVDIIIDILYRKDYRAFSDILDDFYAEKLGTTPEKLREFDKMVDNLYGGDYDEVIKDMEYIRDHPLLFEDNKNRCKRYNDCLNKGEQNG